MRDSEIFQLVEKQVEYASKAKKYEAKADEIKEKVIREMERRDLKALENDNLRVTYVQNETVKYSLDLLKEHLQKATIKRITSEVLDKAKLSAEVQVGHIPQDVVAECSEVFYSKPYIKVTATK